MKTNHVIRRKDIGIVTRAIEIPDNVQTGLLMRKARIKAGISVRGMAKKLNCSAPYVSDLELGRRNWREEMAELWAHILCGPRKAE